MADPEEPLPEAPVPGNSGQRKRASTPLILVAVVVLIGAGFLLGRRSGGGDGVTVTGASVEAPATTTTTVAPSEPTTVAPTTTTVPPAPTTTAPAPPPTPATTAPAPTTTTSTTSPKVKVTGVVNITWYTAEIDPPSGCPGMEKNYQVHVRDGSEGILALSSNDGIREVRRELKPDTGATILECEFTYRATVEQRGVYILTLVDIATQGKVLDRKTLGEADVRAGKIPPLSLFFACTVSAGCGYR